MYAFTFFRNIGRKALFHIVALTVLTVFALGTGSANAQSTCIGCTTGTAPQQFTIGTFGAGWAAGANQSGFGPMGTGTANSATSDSMRIGIALRASGNPTGLCGGAGCLGNAAEITVNGHAAASGNATNTVTGGGGAMSSSAHSGSRVGFGAHVGAIWNPTSGAAFSPPTATKP